MMVMILLVMRVIVTDEIDSNEEDTCVDGG